VILINFLCFINKSEGKKGIKFPEKFGMAEGKIIRQRIV
jgi:hypothetical protein